MVETIILIPRTVKVARKPGSLYGLSVEKYYHLLTRLPNRKLWVFLDFMALLKLREHNPCRENT